MYLHLKVQILPAPHVLQINVYSCRPINRNNTKLGMHDTKSLCHHALLLYRQASNRECSFWVILVISIAFLSFIGPHSHLCPSLPPLRFDPGSILVTGRCANLCAIQWPVISGRLNCALFTRLILHSTCLILTTLIHHNCRMKAELKLQHKKTKNIGFSVGSHTNHSNL